MGIGNLLHEIKDKSVAAEKKVVGAVHSVGNEISKVEHEIVKDAKAVVAVPGKVAHEIKSGVIAAEHGIVNAEHAVVNEIKALPGQIGHAAGAISSEIGKDLGSLVAPAANAIQTDLMYVAAIAITGLVIYKQFL